MALIDLEGRGRRGAAVGGINICVCQHPGLTAELACLSRSGRDILCSWSKEGAEASDNNRINGSLAAHARLMRCAASLLRPFTASYWWPYFSPTVQITCFTLGVDAGPWWNEGALMVTALVASCCNHKLSFFLCILLFLSTSLLLVVFLCSRGRRNSHTRHQVDTRGCLRRFCCLSLLDSAAFPALTRFLLRVLVLFLSTNF